MASFWEVLNDIQKVTGVAAPIASSFVPQLQPILPAVQAAIAIVNATHSSGELDPAAIGQLNLLLQPHGLMVIKLS